MEKKKSDPTLRKLACILVLLFGVFNLIIALPVVFTGFAGAGSVTEIALYAVMFLLGLLMVTAAILGLLGKQQKNWKKMGIVMIGLSLIALLFNLFIGRGISWSYLMNAIAAFAYVACVK